MAEKAPVSLKNILAANKTVEAEFPGCPGFKLKLTFLSRDGLTNIRKSATKQIMKGRQVTEELNEEVFLQEYAKAAIKGWSGLKFAYVQELAPIDANGLDLEDFLEHSDENAYFLMRNSGTFDSWISDVVTDLGKFQKSSVSK